MSHVQLFISCLVDTFYPQTGEAVVNIFHSLGVAVDFTTGQTCCGQPAFNAGLRGDTRPLAEHTIKVFEHAGGDVVTPSGSCAHMLKHGYPELFAGEPLWLSRAESLAARTFEFTEYLVDVLGVTDVGARWDGMLTYHPSCHLLRGMGIDRQPRALLAAVEGATLVDLPNREECCGFGGIFSVEHPEISAEMLKRKIANLESAQVPTLVVADTGCRMHIAGGLHRQKKPQNVIHIAEVLNHR
jgi:L-lactate dehydrogenase complex protein LldE